MCTVLWPSGVQLSPKKYYIESVWSGTEQYTLLQCTGCNCLWCLKAYRRTGTSFDDLLWFFDQINGFPAGVTVMVALPLFGWQLLTACQCSRLFCVCFCLRKSSIFVRQWLEGGGYFHSMLCLPYARSPDNVLQYSGWWLSSAYKWTLLKWHSSWDKLGEEEAGEKESFIFQGWFYYCIFILHHVTKDLSS